MPVLAFYKHIAILASIIKDGHTIILPGEATLAYHNSNSRFLPYKIAIINRKLYVEKVFTADLSIKEDDEILAINNSSSEDILEQLLSRQVREGNNLTYPNWILNNYFKAYYSFNYGHPESFDITSLQDGAKHKNHIAGLTNDSINYYRKLKYPDNALEKRPGEGIVLRLVKDSGYAILTIKDFHNDVLRKAYHQNFKPVIENYFRQIEAGKIGAIILDIRDNQGGDVENGAYLLQHLLSTPFSLIDAYYKVDGKEDSFQLKESRGPATGLKQPVLTVFSGKLVVLTNGGSFSNSGIVAACLRKNSHALFVGEETGGNSMVLAGDAESLQLPNTRIVVEIPTK